MNVSQLAENIIGSEIIKLAGEVNEKIKQGEKIYNLTIGDFNPAAFPIPVELKQYIIDEYSKDQTNYPPADGVPELRKAIVSLLSKRCNLNYTVNEVLVAGGARPLIYAVYRTIVDPNDKVIFAVPSWNNNHYTYLNGAKAVEIEATPENHFMPKPEDIEPHLKDAALVALCSPQNPTGTTFTESSLLKICDLILTENKRRGPDKKPLYLLYDQIYWELTYGEIKHFNPVTLRPEMKDYTIYIDGISKSLSATGVRVGWSVGPDLVINKMKAILSHIGAWAPKAEQLATARFLNNETAYVSYIEKQRENILQRLNGFYNGLISLKNEGFNVDAIAPQAAIYLTVKFDLHGKTTSKGEILKTTRDVTRFLLEEAKIAIVPFYAFGASENSAWYRLSVGTCKMEDVEMAIYAIRKALSELN